MTNKDNSHPLSGANQTIARKHNRAQILNRLRLQGALSRADLAKQTRLTRSTISRIVDDLCSEKLVHEISSAQNDRGRPGILLSLNPKSGAAIGLEIGVHFISILLTDFLSTPIWRDRVVLDDDASWTDYSQNAENLIRAAIDIASQNGLPLMGIGAAIWGMVDYGNRTIHFAPNLHWRDVPLESTWRNLFHVPIYIENDANASALGEYYFGAGKKIEDFVYLSMDIGVGSGIISKGRLFRGASGYAGEIGHITVDPNGVRCSCGRQGCLETKAGRLVIVQRYRDLSQEGNISLEQIIQRGQAGDPIAKKVFDEVGEALGIGIGHVINLFNPKGVILGWSLGQAYNLLLPSIERSLQRTSLSDLRQDMALIPSLNGTDAALLGSIALVLDEIIRESIY
ncbi:MAG: ROK family transcriptional regulator [Anaerolineaceae bacterium]|nr:ROK family transcriptional regulator [Anaerolineaceae bacterium]